MSTEAWTGGSLALVLGPWGHWGLPGREYEQRHACGSAGHFQVSGDTRDRPTHLDPTEANLLDTPRPYMIRHTLTCGTPRKTFSSDNCTHTGRPNIQICIIDICIPGSGRCVPEHTQAPAPLKLTLLENDLIFTMFPILSQGYGGSSVWP